MAHAPLEPGPNDDVMEQTHTILTHDGARLAASVYEPRFAATHTLLVNPAVGAPQGFYARFAREAAGQGVRTVTYDYRGFGRSRDSGGPGPTLTRWIERDYPAVLRWILERYGSRFVSVIGHSLGGQSLGLPPEASALHSAAIVASMRGYVRLLERDRVRAELVFRAMPVITGLLGDAPSWLGLGVALPGAVARQWGRWCLSPDYYLSEHPNYREVLARFRRPLTFLSFEDDALAPLVNVQWLVDLYANARPVHARVAPEQVGARAIGHFGFFRESNRALWPSLLQQLRQPRADFRLRPPVSVQTDDWGVLDDLQYGVA